MELYQLKTFVTVAEEGHMTKAAERLHTSQPSVSAHVKALEKELGVALFVRTPKGMLLTQEGQVLLGRAEKALFAIADIKREAKCLKDELSGTVKLGLHIDPRFLAIDALFHEIQRRHGKIDFHMVQRWSWEQPAAIIKGELDGGYVYGKPHHGDISAIALRTFNIVVAAPAKWKDRLKEACWKDVANLPWIWTPPHCAFTRIAETTFADRGLKPIKLTIADQELITHSLVSSGIGLALMIEEEAREAEGKGELMIWDTTVDTVDLCFIYSWGRRKEPLLKAVVEVIREQWEVR